MSTVRHTDSHAPLHMQVTYLGHTVEGDRPLGGKGGADPGGHRLRPGLVVVLRGKPRGGGIKRRLSKDDI